MDTGRRDYATGEKKRSARMPRALKRAVAAVFAGMAWSCLVGHGCTMAPKYTREKPPIPADWPSGPAYEDRTVRAGLPGAPELHWWDFFPDTRLRGLIELALNNNRDLRTAVLTAERVRALYGIQRAEILPTANATATAGKQRIPGGLLGFPQALTIEQYGLGLGMSSWEIDFFGRIRSLKDRALQEYLATEQASRSLRILVVSSVAQAFMSLAADRENLALARKLLETKETAYRLALRQHEVGILTGLDLDRVRASVEAARAEVSRYTQMVAQDENALTLLAGTSVPEELVPGALSEVAPPQEISPGLPSEVLLRRPDVAQAESLLKAAHADIGAARAAFFPRISLTTTVGTASTDLSGLFASGSGQWSYAAQMVMPIFDARTWWALKASKVQQKLALTQYEKAIQNAFREVADALAFHGAVKTQVEAQQSVVSALSDTYRLSARRYEKGVDSKLKLLDAQRTLLEAQQGLVSLTSAKLLSTVRLYAVLGGGWEEAAPEPGHAVSTASLEDEKAP